MKISAIDVLALLLALFQGNLAFNVENYTSFIEQLVNDGKFLEEYTPWSLELISRPDYFYGADHGRFRCLNASLRDNDSVPTSVHTLRPSDVKCVAAMGDSFLTGLGAHAVTPFDLLIESRGLSWSIGGDYFYSKFLSIPNIFRQYNADLKGFSTKVSLLSSSEQNSASNGLNLGKSGAVSAHMSDQAELLIGRIKNERLCDWKADWKVLTLFVGISDLCSVCEDSNSARHAPEQYVSNIRQALDTLYHAPMPRTLVNLVLAPDVRLVKERNHGRYICELLQQQLCPCAVSPTVEQARILADYIPRYHQVLLDLIMTGRYDGRDDFTVVIQPFMANMTLSSENNSSVDHSYFAPDCFHFSGKGHAQAAFSLWNNMLEPVGSKRWSWHMGTSVKCPTEEYPYIFTSKNSGQALSDPKRAIKQMPQTTNDTSESDATPKSLHKKETLTPKASSKTAKFFVVVILMISMVVIVMWIINRRRKMRMFRPQPGGNVFMSVGDHPVAHEDDDGDVEIWSRTNAQRVYFDDQKTTKTHGTRISFDP